MHLRSAPIALLSILALACTGDDPAPTDPAPARIPTSLEIVSGNEQSGIVNEPLAEPVVIRVLDQNGEPIAGQSVRFDVAAANGRFVDAVVETDADGLVAGEWVLGTIAYSPQIAQVRLLDGASVVDEQTLTATPRPGPLHAVAIIGDTMLELERQDTFFVHLRGYDEFGNARDDAEATWQSSDPGIAIVDGHVVRGVAEGNVVVTGSVGDLSAQMHVFVEGTIATRFAMSPGWLASSGSRLVYAVGDSLYEWDGNAWLGAPVSFAGDVLPTAHVYIAPDDELWLEARVCSTDCEQSAFFRSTDGTTWSESIIVGENGRMTPRLAFAEGGGTVLLEHDYETSGYRAVRVPRVFRLEGGGWVSLDLPRVIGGDSVFDEAHDIAVGPDGDVYVVGVAHRAEDLLFSRPVLAHWDGTSWTFPSVPYDVGSLIRIEAAPDALFAVRRHNEQWDVIRIQSDVVQQIATPLDDAHVDFRALAVSPTGELAIAYSVPEARRGGVVFQTVAGWEQWEHADMYLFDPALVWHGGKVWLTGARGGMAQTDVIRLDPDE